MFILGTATIEISAYPFASVINPCTYALKIASTIVTSNLIAVGFYKLRTRTAQKEKVNLSRAA